MEEREGGVMGRQETCIELCREHQSSISALLRLIDNNIIYGNHNIKSHTGRFVSQVLDMGKIEFDLRDVAKFVLTRIQRMSDDEAGKVIDNYLTAAGIRKKEPG